VKDADRFAAWLLSDFSVDGTTVKVSPAAGFYATPGMGGDEIRVAYVINGRRIEGLTGILRTGHGEFWE
jgi:aspartate aminotransferase